MVDILWWFKIIISRGCMIRKSSENVRKFHYLYFVIRHNHSAQLKKCGRRTFWGCQWYLDISLIQIMKFLTGSNWWRCASAADQRTHKMATVSICKSVFSLKCPILIKLKPKIINPHQFQKKLLLNMIKRIHQEYV